MESRTPGVWSDRRTTCMSQKLPNAPPNASIDIWFGFSMFVFSRWHLASVRKPCSINSQLATRSRCSDTQCLCHSAAAKANSIPTSITKNSDSRLLLEYQTEGWLMGRAAGDVRVAPDATRCRNPAEETMQIRSWLDAHQQAVILPCQVQ